MSHLKVLVERLVVIEDLGDIEVLFTDRTGTLPQADIALREATGPDGAGGETTLLYGLLCTGAGGAEAADPLDAALWRAPAAKRLPTARCRRLDELPFDHERRMASVLVERPDGASMLVTNGGWQNECGCVRSMRTRADGCCSPPTTWAETSCMGTSRSQEAGPHATDEHLRDVINRANVA
ncbi:hypothetical protein [Actinomadura sp. DC4]|uniref:hypothetical protein n=1 Tax=Actinomadura sp. DC4 TaxID=3055069 RepID=UPI0025B11038|nr:hypothetical protein [Actinomadura sp. DC4]MDN3359759.1 hypothetical protein [Actinomadura sp. DC4]